MQSFDDNYSNFVHYLVSHKSLPSVRTIARHLNLSSRKIYYILQHANAELRSAHQPFLFPNEKIHASQIHVLIDALADSEKTESYINAYERQLIMDILISMPLRKWRLIDFQDLFTVSRATALRDISDLKARKEFRPIYDKGKGFMYDSPIYTNLVHAYNLIYSLQYDIGIRKLFISTIDREMTLSKFDLLSSKLQSIYQENLDKKISNYDANALAMFSVILARYYDINTKHMQHLFSHNDILSFTNRQEYEVIDLFTNIVALNFDIQITDFIKYFLTLELLSVSKESDAHFNSEAFQDLLLVSTDIVNTFLTMHENYRPEPEELDQLIESVQTQLKPFWFAVHYQSITNYEYLYHNKNFENKMQSTLESLSKSAIYHQLFPFGLFPDQVTILAMIFYNFYLSHQKVKPVNILLTSALPVYSQNLLRTIILRSDSNINLSIRKLPQLSENIDDFDSFDIIITDTAQLKTKQPTFLIGQELNNSEFERLQKIISEI